MFLSTSAMVCQKHVLLALRAHEPHSRPHTLDSPLCRQTQAARALSSQGFELSLLPKPFPPASTRDYRRPRTTRERASTTGTSWDPSVARRNGIPRDDVLHMLYTEHIGVRRAFAEAFDVPGSVPRACGGLPSPVPGYELAHADARGPAPHTNARANARGDTSENRGRFRSAYTQHGVCGLSVLVA